MVCVVHGVYVCLCIWVCGPVDRRVCCVLGISLCSTTVERKVDLLIAEIKNYNISIAGIQETKWFGSDIWSIREWAFLHSGHDFSAS